jgi:hypothetical protein
VRGRDPLARDLAGRAVEPLGGYLRSMLVESHTIVTRGLLKLHGLKRLRGPTPRLS